MWHISVTTLAAVPVYTLVSISSTFILLSSSPSSPTLQLQLNEIDSTCDMFLNSVLLWIYHLLHLIWVMINNGITMNMLDIGDGLHTSYRCLTIVCYVTNFIYDQLKRYSYSNAQFHSQMHRSFVISSYSDPYFDSIWMIAQKGYNYVPYICYMHSLHQY